MKVHRLAPDKNPSRKLKSIQKNLKNEGIEAPLHVASEYTLSGMLDAIRRAPAKVVLLVRCSERLYQGLMTVAAAPERFDLQPGHEVYVAVVLQGQPPAEGTKNGQ